MANNSNYKTNMITNKTVCKIYQSILYLTFSSSEFVDTFLDIVFVIFVMQDP